MKPVVIQTEAIVEFGEEMEWYESQTPGVGLRLQAEVELAIARLRRNPEWCAAYKRTGFRKQSVNRFPFGVFFQEMPDHFWVVAIANLKRRPGYWLGRRHGSS